MRKILKLKIPLVSYKKFSRKKNIIYLDKDDIIREYETLKKQSIFKSSINPFEIV